MEKNFAVVKFLKDNAVAVVHKSWISLKNDQLVTYWPPFWKKTGNLVAAVKKGEPPNSSTWTTYEITELKAYGI